MLFSRAGWKHRSAPDLYQNITENFETQEDLLNLASLHGTTKGEDIF